MNCMVLSDTFPSRLQPWRGPYNRRQMECLAALCRVTVINPIPFVRCITDTAFWRLRRDVDRVLEGIEIHHPLFWYVPVLGRGRTWRGVRSAVEGALAGPAAGKVDVILATFAYPHGAVAQELASRLNIPYVVKVRGSDLHSLPVRGERRSKTAEAVRNAAAVVAVSGNLADIAMELGANPKRCHVLPNGVDADRFPMIPRPEARTRLGVPADASLILFVGSLLPVKGVDVLARAFGALANQPGMEDRKLLLAVAGSGPLQNKMKQLARAVGVLDRATFLGHTDRQTLARWMNAADVLTLPSRNEGCPNVVLESLCCGTPVVASRVGAVTDILDAECGLTVQPDSPDDLARRLREALDREWDRAAIRRRVEHRSWENNARDLHAILVNAIAGTTP